METQSLVDTIKERCRVCYTCVRECPAKAIRIAGGQAHVLPERCIGCGNCVRVCSQTAKHVLDGIAGTQDLLRSGAPVAAIVAPSFPAEFTDCGYETTVGMLRKLGFARVTEVGFGADLVAREYRSLLIRERKSRFIATTCPSIVAYVERYHPDLIPALAPVVSPMVAMARVLRLEYGAEHKVVFIGPCIAKKGESLSGPVTGEINAVLTFAELRQMLAAAEIAPETVVPSDFDPPRAGSGALFALSRGLLQAAEIEENLISGDIVVTDGRMDFVEAIREFGSGDLEARLLEILCCKGCVMGAGMSRGVPMFRRRRSVSAYVRERLTRSHKETWTQDLARFSHVDLRRSFLVNDQRIPPPSPAEMSRILGAMGKTRPEDELNCGACGYDSCMEHATAIHRGLAESEMCLPHTIEQLRKTVQELASTQEALMHSDRLASMGQLAAGVAHEVNNPLGIVLVYAHMLMEQGEENAQRRQDLKVIVEQADRCKKIVARLLDFARQNKVVLQATDVHDLLARSIRAFPFPANVRPTLDSRTANAIAALDADQIAQVLTNLFDNACDAMPDGGTLRVELEGDDAWISIEVTDTGCGIAPENLGKIFEPFFTTKQIGKGTGLGLAVTYGIVKMHRGDVRVQSNADPAAGPTGTTFAVRLPRNGQRE